jgi:hypothetical protein
MTATTEKKKPGKARDNSAQPPAEQFWQHYSPHGELPLSAAGSFALHALVIGGLIITTVFLANLLFHPLRSIPVEPVRLIDAGGGGAKGAEGTGTGTGARVEDTGANDKGPNLGKTEKDDTPPVPKLNDAQVAPLKAELDPASVRFIQDTNTAGAVAFTQLPDLVRRKLSDGIRQGGGKGGSGEGGGEGSGKGPGKGSGTGPGKQNATLSQREKRMLRWTMRFTANNGPEYVSQLRSLGAILAIPVVEHPEPQYELVMDLRPGRAKLEKKDLSEIQRIYWIDSNPRSIIDVMTTLGLPNRPTRFVAFMPDQLEKKLFEMEKAAMVARTGSYNEDRIEETIFHVVPAPGGGYTARLTDLRLKR